MEKMINVVNIRDGIMQKRRLPPGFRFEPTDEEIVFEYLKCKVFSYPLPASIIPHLNVYHFDPWDLPGVNEQDMYFFSNKEVKYPNGYRTNRTTNSGYWKATGSDRSIVSSRQTDQMIVGMKKTLVFYKGKSPNGLRTDWVMHEYRLANADTTTSYIPPPPTRSENWVLCRIFVKKRRAGDYYDDIMKNDVGMDKKEHTFFNLVLEQYELSSTSSLPVSSTASSSSSTSDITEVSSREPVNEDSSAYSYFSTL